MKEAQQSPHTLHPPARAWGSHTFFPFFLLLLLLVLMLVLVLVLVLVLLPSASGACSACLIFWRIFCRRDLVAVTWSLQRCRWYSHIDTLLPPLA